MAEPKQITIRNVTPELARRLKIVSHERGESLNTTVLRLLEQAVGVNERRQRLARYATWTHKDVEQFDSVWRAQRTIDEKLWK